MKIAIIGPGAMGLLYGGYLSEQEEVLLVGRRPKLMEQILKEGICIRETDGTDKHYYPKAAADTDGMEPADLVILFVKAADSRNALMQAQNLIGPHTYLLTLQNGAGHEALLQEFASQKQILIGTTQQGSYKISDREICHSGKGLTAFGRLDGDMEGLESIRQVFEKAGFPCESQEKVKGMIWNKLMINASTSVLSGLLQTAQGYVAENAYAWKIARALIQEICAAATADGFYFDASEQIARIEKHVKNAPNGYTSIYADLKNHRPTEVDVINGAVVAAGHRLGVPVPTHELIVDLVHAMEGRDTQIIV